MKVRLKDIAQETGVSISTVSRILSGNGYRKEGDKNAQLVIDAAKRMGFFSKDSGHKVILQGHKVQQNYSIGCILTSAHETFVSPFFSSMLAAIQQELSQWQDTIQYNLIVTSLTDPGFSHILESENLDCAIILGRTSQENIVRLKETIPSPVSLTFMTDLSSSMAGIYFVLLCILYAQLSELPIGFCKTSLMIWTFNLHYFT